MAKAPAPDPRFDPRFQRGYDGPQPEPPPPPVAARPEEPVDEPGHGDGAVEGTARSRAGEIDDIWVPPRRNPFALALLIGGLAMIAAGAWLVWTLITASSYPNGYDRGEQAFALIQQQLSPALLICGVLGIVGWLVLGALTASARKRD